MQRVRQEGLYEVECPSNTSSGSVAYRLRFEDQAGPNGTIHDPYAFPPMLGELDLHLFNEGRHLEIYDRLGAHLRTVDGVTGVNFAVWAPNALGVSVVWRLQRVGRPPTPDAEADPVRGLGAVCSRASGRRKVQVPREEP